MENIRVLPLEDAHLEEARRIFRLAFGTFIGLPQPDQFAPGTDFHSHRRLMHPEGAWAALEGDRLVGSVLTTRWGSMGFFGPLTIDPEYWDKGLGQRLLEPVMECFTGWGTRLEGLYTFSSSPKHLALYQKYGFFPNHLVAIMMKPITPGNEAAPPDCTAYSELPPEERPRILESCRGLTDAIYPGLDVTTEIETVAEMELGETLLLREGGDVQAFAIAHQGPGTEAGVMGTYVKFGAARPGPEANANFVRLVGACESYARRNQSPQLILGMNTGRREAYRALLEHGFRIGMLGVAMHRAANGHYHGESDFVIEDLR